MELSTVPARSECEPPELHVRSQRGGGGWLSMPRPRGAAGLQPRYRRDRLGGSDSLPRQPVMIVDDSYQQNRFGGRKQDAGRTELSVQEIIHQPFPTRRSGGLPLFLIRGDRPAVLARVGEDMPPV